MSKWPTCGGGLVRSMYAVTYMLTVENEFTHFQQVMQLYRGVREKKTKKTRGIGTVLCLLFTAHPHVFPLNIHT